jgi:hypothetical protein
MAKSITGIPAARETCRRHRGGPGAAGIMVAALAHLGPRPERVRLKHGRRGRAGLVSAADNSIGVGPLLAVDNVLSHAYQAADFRALVSADPG